MPRDDLAYPLLAAVELSRSRQADLSTVLGEQVRGAVETLLDELNRALTDRPQLLDQVTRIPGTDNELPMKQALGAI